MIFMQSLTNISGLGEKAQEALKRLNITKINDLLWHFPSNIIHRKLYPPLYSLKEGDIVVLKLLIIEVDKLNNSKFSRKKPFKIYCANETGRIQLVFFNYYPNYLLNWAKIDSEIIVVGKIEIYNSYKQISHPEIINPTKSYTNPAEEVIYPLTYGIINKQMQKYVNSALAYLPEQEEWISAKLIDKFGWMGFKKTLIAIHHAKDILKILPSSKDRQRIAYDELLATQLMVNLLRNHRNEQTGRSINVSGKLLTSFISKLPFEPTAGQMQAIYEISTDQESASKMSRLLQGDVGCGKTIIALAAMINVAESGAQSVLMAPTDVLANQHFLTLEKLFINLPIKYAILTGKTKAKERRLIMQGLINGEIQILVGTHAVFQDKVIFNDLALVVIDEQHRFGVEQRLSLLNKGNKADLLVMSATPIPRSLSLALYGDMEITRITEKPKSRIPIRTSIIAKEKLNDIIKSLANVIQEGGKIYWVCPLINESEEKPIESVAEKIAAETRMAELEKFYPSMVGLIHGKLDNKTKQEALDKFIQSEHKILVATTVIEVGVDVPDATVIVIENAESFGLSQLHQLRGRVGRGNKESNCILLYNHPISATSWQRLKILRETEDGFLLAEEDLKLRGGGDIIGTKQSGLPDFKTVDLMFHHNLISLASEQAKEILQKDPKLELPQSEKYRNLLSIFGFDYKKSFMN